MGLSYELKAEKIRRLFCHFINYCMWNFLMIMTIMPSLVACNTPINYTNYRKAISSKERLAVMAVCAWPAKIYAMKFANKILLHTALPFWPQLIKKFYFKLCVTDFVVVCAFTDILHVQYEIAITVYYD